MNRDPIKLGVVIAIVVGKQVYTSEVESLL